MTVIIFILVLLVTVLVHEWGHFFAARKSGMLVEEFGFGIPPKLFSFKKGETNYSINALPIGGFVKIAGENGIEEGVPANRQFETKPWYKKAFVLAAGVICNLLLAVILFTIANIIGMPTQMENGTPTVVLVVPESPASQAGLRVGDKVESIAVGDKKLSVVQTDALREELQKGNAPLTITYTRGKETVTKTITPEQNENGRVIGIGIESIGVEKLSLWEGFKQAITQTINLIVTIWETLGTLLRGVFTKAPTPGGLIGPVGLAREVGGAATIGFAYLLAFTAAISINLAVLNIMPFPALDGGRLIVVLLEAITRRRFSQKVVGLIHAAGFVVLLGFMLILTVSDIKKLF
jgi:regulator of sigma E protease